MAYAKQTWVDGVTPLDAVHMNYMETGLDGTVEIDNVAAAASVIVANKLLAADAQPAFRILGDGKHAWGAGGATAPDTDLYRSGAGVLKTSSQFLVGASLVSTGDVVASDGTAGQVTLTGSGGTPRVYFGTALDTNLYRSSAARVKTDGSFWINPTGVQKAMLVTQAGEAEERFIIHSGGMLQWGQGGSTVVDTNLYRSAASTLKTDGMLIAAVLGISPVGSVPSGGIINKFGVYNQAGAFVGYVPIYAS